MMIYVLIAGAFVLGGVAAYLLTLLRIRLLLREELRSYRRERRREKRWPPEPFPMLIMLKRHKNLYKRESEYRQEELEEVARQLERERANLVSAAEALKELRRENRELKAIVESPGVNDGVREGVARQAGPAGISPGSPRGASTGRAREEVVLYFGIPDHQGHFPAGQGVGETDGRKLYMIVTRPGADRGELHYISGELDMKAISNIDYYLVPVCEIADISVRNSATRVIQEARGAVNLESGKWVCTTRVKVKLV